MWATWGRRRAEIPGARPSSRRRRTKPGCQTTTGGVARRTRPPPRGCSVRLRRLLAQLPCSELPPTPSRPTPSAFLPCEGGRLWTTWARLWPWGSTRSRRPFSSCPRRRLNRPTACKLEYKGCMKGINMTIHMVIKNQFKNIRGNTILYSQNKLT